MSITIVRTTSIATASHGGIRRRGLAVAAVASRTLLPASHGAVPMTVTILRTKSVAAAAAAVATMAFLAATASEADALPAVQKSANSPVAGGPSAR